MTEESTLAGAPLGEELVLTTVSVPPTTARRLAELGLRSGAVIEVLRRTAGDGRVVAVAGSRIALDRDTTRSLNVTPHLRPALAQETDR
jgi:ferrous iron transport protein A